MHIRMLKTWSYDLVKGVSRRTLPAGLNFDEPTDVAEAAIEAGAAEAITVEAAARAVDVSPAVETDAGGDKKAAGKGKGEGKGKSAPKAKPAAPPATPPAVPGAGNGEVSPADPVDPDAGA